MTGEHGNVCRNWGTDQHLELQAVQELEQRLAVLPDLLWNFIFSYAFVEFCSPFALIRLLAPR